MFPPTAKKFPSPLSTSAIVVCFPDDSNSDWSEMGSQCHLIRVSFTAKDFEYFFTHLLAICSSFENSSIHLPIY
jgi:hypothetical protein